MIFCRSSRRGNSLSSCRESIFSPHRCLVSEVPRMNSSQRRSELPLCRGLPDNTNTFFIFMSVINCYIFNTGALILRFPKSKSIVYPSFCHGPGAKTESMSQSLIGMEFSRDSVAVQRFKLGVALCGSWRFRQKCRRTRMSGHPVAKRRNSQCTALSRQSTEVCLCAL